MERMEKKMDKQFGLIGFPLEHSVSDVLHKNLFEMKKNKDSKYNFYETNKEEFSEKLDVYRHTLNGFNVTVPYKIKIADYLDFIDEHAKIIGAVNTVKTSSGFLNGYNTDIDGLEYCFKQDKVGLNKKTALIIGCGGLSKTAAYFLHLNKAHITVCGRDMQKLIAFQKECDSNKIRIEIKSLKNLSGEFDIIINCTPVGQSPFFDKMPLDPNLVKCKEYYFDAIYNPRKTLLYKHFEGRKILCRDGLLMLVVQAAKAQEIFFGYKFSNSELLKAYFDLGLHMFKKVANQNLNSICLTGFMGSGKTTVGKELAKLIGFKFIDTDKEIEDKYGKINSIFKNDGEKKFREYETEILTMALKNKKVVIATGGGAVEKNSKIIKEKSFCIYLACDFFEITKRVYSTPNTVTRPLFKDLDVAEELYKKRTRMYENSCHLKINGNTTLKENLLEIFSAV